MEGKGVGGNQEIFGKTSSLGGVLLAVRDVDTDIVRLGLAGFRKTAGELLQNRSFKATHVVPQSSV